MGSCSRTDRCDRFIKEFNDDYVKENGVVGDNIVSQGLGFNDLQECVFYYLTVKFESGTYELMMPDIVFDPESPSYDTIEMMANLLNVPQSEIEARMDKCGLLW